MEATNLKLNGFGTVTNDANGSSVDGADADKAVHADERELELQLESNRADRKKQKEKEWDSLQGY